MAAIALPASARAQAAASASVNATARFVDPVGVSSVAEPGLAPMARPQRGVRAAMAPGSLTVTGPQDQAYSIEAASSAVLKHASGLGEVRLELSARRQASEVRLEGRLTGAEDAPAGRYAGQLSTVINFN